MKNLKVNLTNKYYMVEGKVRKYSPEILAGLGVVGVISSAVMACKATTKLDGILSETKEQVDLIKTHSNNPSYADKYSEDDAKKDLAITYVQSGAKVAKLYGPSIALGTLSLSCLLQSNNILRKRNAALSAAYLTLDTSFKEYKERVKDRFGEQIEKEIRYNIKAKTIEKEVVDEEGNPTGEVTTETVNVADPNLYSDYARFFDESCVNWQREPEYNLMFLKSQQQYANDLLVARGRLFLNEVYDMLGIERTKAGQVVGWVYNKENPVGDNFVDFGIYDMDRERVRAFVNGYEPNILLDFNVDGDVWSLM